MKKKALRANRRDVISRKNLMRVRGGEAAPHESGPDNIVKKNITTVNHEPITMDL